MNSLVASWNSLPDMVRRAVYVGLAVFALLLLVRYVWARDSISNSSKLAGLVRQAARWGAAAEQDGSALMALNHANYAAAYLQVLRELYGDAAVADAASSFRLSELQAKIDAIQVRTQREAASQCPLLQPASSLEASTLL